MNARTTVPEATLLKKREWTGLRFATLCVLVASIGACAEGAADDVVHRAPSNVGVVDSVLPWDTALARFRAPLDSVARLTGGATSRDELVREFVVRLERSDTAGIAGLVITPAEFAWLYYPTVPEAHPPYDLSPALLWFMIDGASRKGLRGLVTEHGGKRLNVLNYTCDDDPRRDGELNLVWAPCSIRRVRAQDDTVVERLFGPILQRNGRFKFVSLANKL